MAAQKKYQVFVSSTYHDLKEERRAVMHALLEVDCIPAGMELFPAADMAQWTLIEKQIDACDYYVLIIGARYGSLHPSGRSYTEAEYYHAVSRKKPVLVFVHADPDSLGAARRDADPSLSLMQQRFRRKCLDDRICKLWKNPDELNSVVKSSLIAAFRDYPTSGWIRDNAKELEGLQKENAVLRARLEQTGVRLTEISSSPDERLARQPDDVQQIFARVISLQGPYARAYFEATNTLIEARNVGTIKENRIAIEKAIRLFVSERFGKLTRASAFPEMNNESTRDALYQWAWMELAAGNIRVHGKQATSAWGERWVAEWTRSQHS
jgi:hypothetical protein